MHSTDIKVARLHHAVKFVKESGHLSGRSRNRYFLCRTERKDFQFLIVEIHVILTVQMKIDAEESRIAIEAIESEIVQITAIVFDVLLRNYPMLDFSIHPLPVELVIILPEPLIQRRFCFVDIESFFVSTDYPASGIMGALENKSFRQS